MSFNHYNKSLHDISKRLTQYNHKDIKQELIAIQEQLSAAEFEASEKQELRKHINEVFDRINVYRQKDMEAFEQEADKNFAELKKKLLECITFVETYLDDHDATWAKLLEMQDAFRGRRMRGEEREYLYNGLQQLFNVVKKRKDEAMAETAKQSEKIFPSLDEEVAHLVSIAETADIDLIWSDLVDISNRVRNSELVFTHRKRLLDSLQDGFTIVKIRKEERQRAFENESETNAAVISQKLLKAAESIKTNADFKSNWDLLLGIQNDFRELKLQKADREVLYGELQDLFERVKAGRETQQTDFEKAANESMQYLQPLVEKASEQARKSQEFKKTKNFLIKVQSEFKGRRMRSEERERLYSKLQSAFDTLNQRINEHIAARKEVREFRIDSKMSDIRKQIEDLEASIATDMEKLKLLENKIEDTKILSSLKSEENHLLYQQGILKAAIDHKTKQLIDLQEEMKKAQERKDWLENI